MVVVYGAVGAGKSQLVLNYIQRHRRDYTAVLQIEAGTKAAVERDFVQTPQLLYDMHSIAGPESSRIEDSVPTMERWLYGRRQKWLFVFDNGGNVLSLIAT
jgi:Ni2+-binding GTPase involved in maturation of urease and hydrogenase